MAPKRKNTQKQANPPLQIEANALSVKYHDLNTLKGARNLDFMGTQLERGRNLICQYGYPEAPTFNDYYSVYLRIGLARAGCDMPVDAVWSDWPTIRDVTKFDADGKPEYDDSVKTEFEQVLTKLFANERLALKDRIKSLDRKQRVGQYAGSLIIARDRNGAKMNEPLRNLLAGQIEKLVPFYESQIKESQWDTNQNSPTYGEPTMYLITEYSTGANSISQARSFECHPSRVIMAAEGAEDGTNYGKSAIQPCFYALMDWEKIRMSSAEGSKKNADQRLIGSFDKDTSMPTGKAAEMLDEDMQDFEKGRISMFAAKGMAVTPLNSSMLDPTKSAELCEKEISAGFKAPMTQLMGYQTGKLASEKDGDKWNAEVMARRDGFGTSLIMAHLNKFIALGALPKPNGEIVVDWPDARDPSRADKLSMGERSANIIEKLNRAGVNPDIVEAIANSMLEDMDIDVVDTGSDTGGEGEIE